MYTRIVFCLCVILIALAATAAAQSDSVPNVINYQGVLLDAAGQPVTTPVSMRYSYYLDSTDVAPLFAETLLVQPDNSGRFCSGGGPYGSSVSNLEDAGYVGVGVGADPEMTPRIRLGSAPFAFFSSGVNGDIQTGPGSIHIWDPGDGSFDDDTVCLRAGSGKATLSLYDGPGNRNTLTENSIIMVAPTGDTTAKIDSAGNASFAGDIKSGNSLVLKGNSYELVTSHSNGDMYLGKEPGTFSAVRVGIGTHSPTATLHVEGTTYLNGIARIADGQRLRAAADGGVRILGEQGNTKERPAIGFFSTDGLDDGGGGNGIYRPLANTMAFAVQSSERVRITGWGVEIGAPPASPTGSHVLHVNGPVATAVTTITGNTTLAATHSVVLANNSGGAITVTLPAANACSGRQYTVKKISSNLAGNVNVIAGAGDTIDFGSYALAVQYEWVVLVSDGVNRWYTVGR